MLFTNHFSRPIISLRQLRAFTLIELLTVIAIIGILAAIIIPTVGKVRRSAARSVSASNLRQLGIALTLYANEHKRLPYATENPDPSPTGQANPTWDLLLHEGGYLSVNMKTTNRWVDTADKKIFKAPNDDIVRSDARLTPKSYCANAFVFDTKPNDMKVGSVQGQLSNAVKPLSKIVMLFERPTNVNMYGQPGSSVMPDPNIAEAGVWDTPKGSPNYLFKNGGNYLFCDGHVEFLDVRKYGNTTAAAALAMQRALFEPM